MTKKEIIEAISEDKIMPFIQPEQLSEIVDFVIKNYHSGLPSNLDEAADCYKDTVTPEEVDDSEHAYSYETYTEYQIADAFKAGAEWMAWQGVTKEAAIGMATGKIIISVSEQTLNELDLCPGDKVVVQIRKK